MQEVIMKFGLDIPTGGAYADPRKLAELAAEAEEAGWDGFFVQDVLYSVDALTDPWVALAAVAVRTQRMRIGVFLTPIPRRRPWQLAREAVALDYLSNGRLIFGAALGFQELDFTPFGEEYDARIRAEKLDEGLEILKGLWSGEPFSFQGKHYQLENITFLPRPLQSPRIPIWLAGGWPRRKPLRRAAHWDGIYLMTVNQVTNELLKPEEIREAVAYMQAQRESTDPFDVGVNGEVPGDAGKAAEFIQAYQEAGATWWIDLEDTGETFEEYRARIRCGPPR
jgi:alkanesulfonate monooxygenase SsuD/methylene tetrahydromethanopterin reductase-like flavin-dependent oxidoreductase (luciferase family)